MLSNRIAFVAVSLACVAAAAGGGYLATRQNQASAASAPSAANPAAIPAASVPQATSAVTAPFDLPATTAPVPADALAPSSAVAHETHTRPAPPARTDSTTARKSPARPAASPDAAPRARTSDAPAAPAAPQVAQALPPATLPAQPDAAPVPATPSDSAPRPDDAKAPEAPAATEPERAPEKTFDEIVVSADSVIGLQIEGSLTSETAKVEDRVDARVIRDVRVGSHVAIPAGARALGTVTVVDRGGRMKDRARLGIRFNTIVLADGTRIPVTTDTIFRYGEAPGNGTAQKVGGGAVIGTILGGILGGAKGAAVGAAAGAGGGAAAAAAGDRSVAEFPAGTQMTARFLAPVTVTVEH
jgi:type IV secretory pathway VirB10-like protein